jgi:hypothetical protein
LRHNQLAISAKQQELKDYPETQGFECPGETIIEPKKDGSCLVM